MIEWLADASVAAILGGTLCAWRSLHVPCQTVANYEIAAGVLLLFGLSGFGIGLAAAIP
jgi:hypothetical protein